MSALTHPVGPEPEGVYWVRRALVVAVIVALIALVSIIVSALGGGGSSAGNTPVIVTSAPASSSAPTQVPSGTPVVVGPISAPASQPPVTQAPATKPAATKPAATKPSTAAASTVANKATSGPVACAPQETAVRISGSGRVKIGATTSFYVVLLSTGTQTCQLTPAAIEVKIYSGKDRIWSTQDCAAWLPKGPITLKPGVASRFAVNWTTQRSAAQCQLNGTLRPGTYVATALVTGGTPHQHVMLLS